MIDRTKLPDFFRDMPEERQKELMEVDDKADCFNKAMARFSPNYFLYYALIKYYQQNFKYLDLSSLKSFLLYSFIVLT